MSEEDNVKLFVVFLLVVFSLWGNRISLNEIEDLKKMIIENSSQRDCVRVNHE